MKKRVINRSKPALPLSELRFTGHEDHSISLAEASELTRHYRRKNPGEHIAEFFGRDAILAILSQNNCVGIRIYYGLDEKTNQKHLVLVGAEPNKNDIIDGLIMERSKPCPNHCGKSNLLNT
jgi:hypothetical protein